MKNLGILHGDAVSVSYYANDINNSGQVVGSTDSENTTDPPHQSRAWLWTPGGTDGGPSNPEMRDLMTLGGTSAHAMEVDAAGTVVGGAEAESGSLHAFHWVSGSTTGPIFNPEMKDLGVPQDASFSYAGCINDKGQIAGWAGNFPNDEPSWAPVHWEGDTIGYLGHLGYGPEGKAYAIGNGGEIVGYARCDDPDTLWDRAFLYRNGRMTDLNKHLMAPSGWKLAMASGINDSGQIVGRGYSPNGQYHAFLATPLEEASAPAIGLGETRLLATHIPNTDVLFTLTGGCGCSDVHAWATTTLPLIWNDLCQSLFFHFTFPLQVLSLAAWRRQRVAV
jgi:probable HAF family extracellular repeat protein